MTHIVKYAVLRYSPSVVAGEAINLGLLVSNEFNEHVEFHYTKKWDRVSAFDDTLNVEGLKDVMEDIKNDVEKPLIHGGRQFSFENFVRNFVNELHFSAPYQLECESLDAQIMELRKLYLRFDYKPEERLKPDDEKNFIKMLLKGKGIKFSRNSQTLGDFDVPINYDFTFGKYGVRYIRFRGKNIARMMTGIKAWAWDSDHDPFTTPIFIYSPDGTEPKNADNMKKARSVLQSASDNVFSIDDPQIGDMLKRLYENNLDYSLLSKS